MTQLFRKTWFLATLALILGIGMQAGLWMWHMGELADRAQARSAAPVVPETIVWDFITPAIDELRGELQRRVDAVAAREKELADYEVRLRAERAEIEKLKRDIEARRAELSTTVTEIQSSEQKNLKTLAATYSNLTPTAALAIFREMDDETVVKILAFMKPDPVGQILEEMARTKEGEGTLAGRAAVISNKLRLLRQVKAEENS